MSKYYGHKDQAEESVKDKIVDALFEGEKLEITEQDLQRRLHFAARIIVTVCQFALLILMLFLLFYQVVPDSSRDLVSAITGMLVISQKDAVQYWFGHHRIEGSNH